MPADAPPHSGILAMNRSQSISPKSAREHLGLLIIAEWRWSGVGVLLRLSDDEKRMKEKVGK